MQLYEGKDKVTMGPSLIFFFLHAGKINFTSNVVLKTFTI